MDFVRIIIKGKVQGVGYRYFVYNNALKKRARGYVTNLNDGDLEILLDKLSADDTRFMDLITQGPILSRVDKVVIDKLSLGGNIFDFNIK